MLMHCIKQVTQGGKSQFCDVFPCVSDYLVLLKIQLLHCIEQVKTQGGENQFCDGFKVAEDLRYTDPEVFHILSTTPIDFRDCGTDISSFHLKLRRPTIT